MNEYVTLVRVSTDKQELETQIEENTNYIRSLEGGAEFKLKIFQEPDTSSGIFWKKRHVLQEFLAFLRPHHRVVLYTMDRLARDIIEMVTIWRIVKNKGCTIYSPVESWCNCEMTIGIIGSVAQRERSMIRKRITDKLKTKKSKEERTSLHLPYGYNDLDKQNLIYVKNQKGLAPGKMLPSENEQRLIEVIKTLHPLCETIGELTRKVNGMGFLNRAGMPFQNMTIWRILNRLGLIKKKESTPQDQEEGSFLILQ